MLIGKRAGCMLLACALIAGVWGCGHKNTAQGVAGEFLFRYFIELNQRGALELSTGLAVKKLKQEIELTQNVRMTPDLDLAKSKPFLDYKLVRTQAINDETATLFYDVSIENPGGEDAEREIVLSAAKVLGVWKISNFETFMK